MIILVALATIIFTFLGGLFAIRFKDKLHLILGFSAGAVIGVALFDLLPESIHLASRYGTTIVASLIGLGFIIYLLLDRSFAIHCVGDSCENPHHRGRLGAATLSFHSLLDGLGIGLAFKISPSIGWVVAAAVLTHDFSDGINTVNMILKSEDDRKEAFKWLIIDALAPAIGVLATIFISVSQPILGLIFAIFTGFFLYIGASDLVPESHRRHPAFLTTLMTILGIMVIFTAVLLVG